MKATLKSINPDIKWPKDYRFFVDFMSSEAWKELKKMG